MENLSKNFPTEDQFLLVDHVQSSQSAVFDDELLKYFPNMNNTIDPSNNNDSNRESSDSLAITGSSGLQPYHHQQDLAEIGNSTLIHIPFYFENNNVYSRDTYSNCYDQQHELQSKNALLQNNSDLNFEQRVQNTRFPVSAADSQYDQNEWAVTLNSHIPQISSVNEIYPNHNIGLSQMVLESPFPSPDLLTMTTLPVSTSSYSLIPFGDCPINSRRSQTFPPLYETEYQPRVAVTGTNLSTNTLSQKPPVYTKWTEEEDELLRAAISIYGPHKWSLIAAHVPNRTPMQCSTRWLGALNPTIHKGRWTPEEDAALKEAVSEYVDLLDSDGHPQPIPWNKIASRIPHRTGIQCQARWSEALDPSVRKGKWSPEEDEVLKEGVRRYGRCWIRIAELIEGRTQRQCRTRWVQIKNKQAKIERDAKVTTETTTSTDDEGNEILTPPHTTPSTPAQPIINNAQGQDLQGLLRSMNHMTPVVPQVTAVKNQSPIMSPTGTSATEESCVTTPENLSSSSPYFEKPNQNNVYLFTHSYLP
ncbi:homeodomain-like protein [Rhizophagus clarus]|uniref:Homeodomain-like protein n=1 Tax=Rhizophagus clarus TaxID=94130 RepID=A0A8H3KYA8_9GLOM|nr:homeodomain-like protein [Rhizophagus clarus]